MDPDFRPSSRQARTSGDVTRRIYADPVPSLPSAVAGRARRTPGILPELRRSARRHASLGERRRAVTMAARRRRQSTSIRRWRPGYAQRRAAAFVASRAIAAITYLLRCMALT